MGPLLGKGGLSHARRKGYLLTHTLKSSTFNIIESATGLANNFNQIPERRKREREGGKTERGEREGERDYF